MRNSLLISRTVLVEAVRRKEIYAIVLISLMLIAATMTVNFFKLEGLAKFYRETGLQIMSIATALSVIVLAARQLPREFESRTIYPLLAKPVSRFQFLMGKILGVLLAAAFCSPSAVIVSAWLCCSGSNPGVGGSTASRLAYVTNTSSRWPISKGTAS